MGTVIFRFLLGGLAGLLAWILFEPFRPAPLTNAWALWEANLTMVFGMMLGAAVGGLDGFNRGGRVHTLRGLFLGLLFGMVGAQVGRGIGGLIQNTFFSMALTSGVLPVQMLARTIILIPLGAMLGLAIGGSSLNPRKAIQGLIGGALGGAVGGALFDPVSLALQSILLADRLRGEVGGPGRAAYFIITGSAIGLFIGLVDRIARRAWLRLSLGRNEGREWSLDANQNFIGSQEGVQVPLFGDRSVAPVHAVITRQGGQFVLQDNGYGTFLNGVPVQQAVLAPGSMIQIGSFQLQFMVKGTPVAYVPGAPVAAPTQSPPTVGMPPAQPSAPTQMPGGLWNSGASQPTQAYASAPVSNVTVAYGAPAGMPSLVALDGPLAGQRFPIQGALEIGREGAHVRLAGDANASRRHAQVAPGPTGAQLTDLGSTNGSYVNGHRVNTALLSPGDLVKVGSTTFRIES